MQLNFTPEQEAQLSRLASHQGMNAEELAKDVLLRLIEDNERFLAAVKVGVDQADRGEFIAHEEVRQRINRLLRQWWTSGGHLPPRTTWKRSFFASGKTGQKRHSRLQIRSSKP